MKRGTQFRNMDELNDSADESDYYFGPVLDAPKQSPMRRKEKLRKKDFKTQIKPKGRKRDWRSHIKYNNELLED